MQAAIEDLFDHKPEQYTPEHFALFARFKAALNAGLWPAAVAGLVLSVVAAFYYLRLVKTMWFDPPVGAVDASPLDAKAVAIGAALFSFPLVLVALTFLDPAATAAAAALGTH